MGWELMIKRSIKNFIWIFQNAIKDIEALKEFYYRTRKSITGYRLEVDEKYAYGKAIADLFDSVLEKESFDERNIKIDEIYNVVVFDDVKLKDICDISKFEKNTKTLSYIMNAKYKQDRYSPNVASQKYINLRKNEHILVGSILSNIITIFETALSNIYMTLIRENPLRYLENQTISLAAVFRDFKQALDDKLDLEVESKIYKSLEFLNILETKEKIKIDRYEKITAMFTEIYYRRNSYVHTDGRANKRYLENVDKKFTKDVSDGDLLVCDDTYIENAILALTKILFSIIFELLTIREADSDLIGIISNYFFSRLKDKEYELASCGYYALSQYKKLDFKDRTMYRINYINAKKQLGYKSVVARELNGLDVSIATDDFKIAKECLLNNHENVFKLLQSTYPNSYRAIEIKEWPIFIDFRLTSYYEEFVKLHQKDFELEEMEFDDDLIVDEDFDE